MDLMKTSLLLITLSVSQAALPLPPFMTKCTTREREALNACARDNARRTVAQISATGSRKYGVPPIDPAFIERLEVEQNGLVLDFTNLTLYTEPPGSWSVDDIDLDLEERRLNIHYSAPAVMLKSKYRMEGRILILALKGSGDCLVRLENYNGLYTVQFDVVKNDKDGLEYVKLKNSKIDANTTKSTFNFGNLFKGQETLSQAAHEIANNNWKEIYEETKGSTLEAISQFLTSVLQSFFNAVPNKELFPEK